MKKLKVELKDAFFILFFILGIYLYEFYFFLDESRNLRCLEILSQNISIFEIKVPVHCDLQYYFNASNSLDYFFSSENPYQKRPIYVFVLYFFQFVVKLLPFSLLDAKQVFLLSTVLVQASILFLIAKQITIFFDLEKENNKRYFYFLIFFLIPNIRWNLFFPSHGSLTLLGMLFTLNLVSTKKTFSESEIVRFTLAFGVLGLAHRLFVIFGLIFLLFYLFKNKKFNSKIVPQALILAIPTMVYNFSISKLGFTSFDYNAVAYKQFYWLIDKLNGLETFNGGEFCQEISSFYKCNFSITLDVIKFYWYQILLLLLFLTVQKKFYKNFKLLNLITIVLFIYLFWAFIGWYPPFRFINYSLGYFIFITFALIVRYNFKNEILYILSMVISLLDVQYLGVYNNPDYFLLTVQKTISVLILLTALALESRFLSNRFK